MSDSAPRSTKELFRAWRSGDPAAGQEMAQRFADWYYAIATSRLGEEAGRKPCEDACARFGAGIVDVTESRALVKWAHGIIQDELNKTPGRTRDGDEANAYTGNQKPKGLLVAAKEALPTEVAILEGVYSGKASEAEVDELTEPLGGNPIGVLKSRYRVKKWLRDNQSVPFEVAPDDPVLDRAPMPLYESGRMGSPNEETTFEQWMLTDLNLCRDIAEFAHFAIALRGGLDKAEAPAPKKAPARKQGGQKKPPAEASSGGAGKAALGVGAVAAAGLAIVLLVVAVLAGLYFGGVLG